MLQRLAPPNGARPEAGAPSVTDAQQTRRWRREHEADASRRLWRAGPGRHAHDEQLHKLKSELVRCSSRKSGRLALMNYLKRGAR